jgi:hypothetical protein
MVLQPADRMRSMMSKSVSFLCRVTVALVAMTVVAGWASQPAQARVFFGVGIPFYGPGYYPPPVYYPPPPVYYAPPPPVYYTPPQQSYVPPPPVAADGSSAGQACNAGAYVCPMDRPVASGGSCYCPGNSGQKVWGRAN